MGSYLFYPRSCEGLFALQRFRVEGQGSDSGKVRGGLLLRNFVNGERYNFFAFIRVVLYFVRTGGGVTNNVALLAAVLSSLLDGKAALNGEIAKLTQASAACTGRTMASSGVLQRHLWLSLTTLRE
ncbi:hypothetical protein DPEC_G00177730 [Dallia pectoralis]|uniref:Uncharacterized protein n=1 Tax=Dallia pectoralis TaxID=75939 RepID=A0ACC2GEZ2_DALPE|nr:hypothetical protein DPEC_G00177730 [Dallia pectoralis]